MDDALFLKICYANKQINDCLIDNGKVWNRRNSWHDAFTHALERIHMLQLVPSLRFTKPTWKQFFLQYIIKSRLHPLHYERSATLVDWL